MVQQESLLIGTIVVASGLVAFAAVRTGFVLLGAADVHPATLTVETEPAGADLLIDSQPRGTTPETLTIDPGVHTVLVRLNGAERTLRLSLGSGARMAQYLDLKQNAPADVVSRGRLSIVTEPPGPASASPPPVSVSTLPAPALNAPVAASAGVDAHEALDRARALALRPDVKALVALRDAVVLQAAERGEVDSAATKRQLEELDRYLAQARVLRLKIDAMTFRKSASAPNPDR